MTAYDYRGVDHLQRTRTGRLAADTPADLAHYLYDQGWKRADITVDGILVGQVTTDATMARTWWGDGPNAATAKPVRRKRERSRR